jgi:hypothetical protein
VLSDAHNDAGLLEPKDLDWIQAELAAQTSWVGVRWILDVMNIAARARDFHPREEVVLLALEAILAKSEWAVEALLAKSPIDWNDNDRAIFDLMRGGRRRGPKSHRPEMAEIARALRAEGRVYRTKKAEWRAVLEWAGMPETARGWSYNAFTRLKI